MGYIEYYLAGDPAKQHDYFGLVILERDNKNIRLKAWKELQMDYNIVTEYIVALYKKYRIKKIFLDLTGVGLVLHDMFKGRNLNTGGMILTNAMKMLVLENTIRLYNEERLKLPFGKAGILKSQLQEQERSLTQTGMVRLSHPGNSHDDLFWAFCIGCYCVRMIIDVPQLTSYGDVDLRERDTNISSIIREEIT